MEQQSPIIIVGAGAAGIGLGVLLKHLELPFIIIDQGKIGESFLRWPDETQFISPSFSGNAFGAVDLNAITPDTSPAFSLFSEHPNGAGYARYLNTLAHHFELPVVTGVRVNSISHDASHDEPFRITTSKGVHSAKYVVWAAGEFQYPNLTGFTGAEHCRHYADVATWTEISGDQAIVIGGYESGVDAAYQLAKQGKSVTLFDADNTINKHGSDSSYSLSPFTRDRYRSVKDNITVIRGKVTCVEKLSDGYTIHTNMGEKYPSKTAPINCTGFSSSLQMVKPLFDFKDGIAQLTELDESTICPNLFLSGPQVRHGQALFCFIYKFRQRFGIVGEALSQRIGGDKELRKTMIDLYKKNQFYLDDLSCCDDECSC